MPIAEAKACGVPAFAVDYSAMSEQVTNIPGCQPIRVEKFFYEPIVETEQKRALPDNMDLVKKMFKFFNTSKQDREFFAKECRKDVVENYSFDRAAKVFEEAIDNMEIHDHKDTWYNPNPNILPASKPNIKFNNPNELIDWCIDNIIKKPDLKNTYWRHELVKGLTIRNLTLGGGNQYFGPDEAVNFFLQIAQANNFWHKTRIDSLNIGQKTVRWENV